jgi:hypothetical protein
MRAKAPLLQTGLPKADRLLPAQEQAVQAALKGMRVCEHLIVRSPTIF